MALQNANPLTPLSSLTSNARPSSVDTRVQNQNFFPTEAFEFESPNDIRGNEDVELKMSKGWKFYVEGVTLDQLNIEDRILLEDAIIRSQNNELDIINMGGAVNLNADEIELRVKAIGPDGEAARDAVIRLAKDADGESYVYVDASSIYLGDKDGNPETLDGILTIVEEDGVDKVKIAGDLEIQSDDKLRFISVGSRGLYAEDGAPVPNIIHDLPDAPFVDEVLNIGHFYFLRPVDTYIYTFSGSSGGPLYNWVTVQANTAGCTNIKGVLLSVELNTSNILTYTTWASSIALSYFRPNGTSWLPNFDLTTPFVRSVYEGYVPANTAYGASLIKDIIVPVDSDGKFQIYARPSSFDGISFYIRQRGIFI